MALEIDGKLVKVLPEVTGQGAKGPWVKQNFVIETKDQYPKQICFTAWNDKADNLKKLALGEDLKVHFNAESREFNEKWYTELIVWRIDKVSIVAVTGATSNRTTNNTTTNTSTANTTVSQKKQVVEDTFESESSDFPDNNQEDDLPF